MFQKGRKAAITAITMAGNKFATRIFLPQTRLMPTQNIRIEPMVDKFPRAASVISGLISTARAVMLPWKMPTGIAEKMQPLPREQVMTIIMIRSRIALVVRMA